MIRLNWRMVEINLNENAEADFDSDVDDPALYEDEPFDVLEIAV